MLLHHRGNRRQLGEALDARLRLCGLAGFGAKAVDEGLQVRALGLLLGARRGLQALPLRQPALEIVEPAQQRTWP
jgi:hypothetical protein